MPRTHLDPAGPWGVEDAILLWFRRMAQWMWEPLRRGVDFIFQYGVPPPVMVFPDSKGAPGQFPPLSALGFIIASGTALPVWREDEAGADEPTVEPAVPVPGPGSVEEVRPGPSHA